MICIQGYLEVYERLVNVPFPLLVYLPGYKLRQDHIELFFGMVRSQGGCNNNPTARQFAASFKRLLIHNQIGGVETGNCLPLEQISILFAPSVARNSEDIINATTEKQPMLNTAPASEAIVDHDYCSDPAKPSEFSKCIVVYIAGHVVHATEQKIQCKPCLNSLRCLGDDHIFSFVKTKTMGKLVFPSKDVVKICERSEHCFYIAVAQSPGRDISRKLRIELMTTTSCTSSS